VRTQSATQPHTAYWGTTDVDVVDKDVTEVVLPLRHAGRISGRVVAERSTSTTHDSVASLVGLTLTAVPVSGGGEPNVVATQIRSADDGRFVLDGLLPEQYALVLVDDHSVKSITWRGADYSAEAFDASEVPEIDGVEVTVTDEVAHVSGTVTSGDRAATAAGAIVICFPTNPSQWSYWIGSRRIRTTKSSAIGKYTLDGLAAGDYYLAAVAATDEQRWRDPAYLASVSHLAQRVSLSWGGRAAVDLHQVQSGSSAR